MCGLEVGCRCVFSNTKRRRKGREGGREGREEKPEQNWECDRQTWSLPSALQVQDRTVRKHFLFFLFFFFFILPWKHKRERLHRQARAHVCTLFWWSQRGPLQNMAALWFALFSPIDYDARMHSLYVCFFSLCTVCVCVCVWTSPRGYITLYVAPCFILHCIWLKRCRSQPCSCTPSLLIETNTASLDANTLASKHMHTETYKQYT